MKKCPICSSTVLLCNVTYSALGTVEDDGNIKVIKMSDNYTVKVSGCSNKECSNFNNMSDDDLVVSSICKVCNQPVNVNELNEDGVCIACKTIEEKPDFGNLTKEELLRMLLRSQLNSNGNNVKEEKLEKKHEAAETVQEKIETQAAAAETEKPKRAKRVKKAIPEMPETTASTPVETAPVQTAPVPEVSVIVSAPEQSPFVAMPAPVESAPITPVPMVISVPKETEGDFQMFSAPVTPATLPTVPPQNNNPF